MATAEMNPWMSVIVRVMMMMMRLLLLSMRVTVKRRFLSILLVVLVHKLAGYPYLIHAAQTGWHRYDINSQSSLDVLIKHVS